MVTHVLGRLRQENWEFEASLAYLAGPCLTKQHTQKKEKKIRNTLPTG